MSVDRSLKIYATFATSGHRRSIAASKIDAKSGLYSGYVIGHVSGGPT